jgi:8-oxo-dGTP pyrophosphatase MutT (NUDIX family)
MPAKVLQAHLPRSSGQADCEPLPGDTALREAVEEAGYEFAG